MGWVLLSPAQQAALDRLAAAPRPADAGDAAFESPAYLLAEIVGEPTVLADVPFYSWRALEDQPLGALILDGTALAGDPTYYPAVELNYSQNVPPGTTVKLWPARGGQLYFWFEHPPTGMTDSRNLIGNYYSGVWSLIREYTGITTLEGHGDYFAKVDTAFNPGLTALTILDAGITHGGMISAYPQTIPGIKDFAANMITLGRSRTPPAGATYTGNYTADGFTGLPVPDPWDEANTPSARRWEGMSPRQVMNYGKILYIPSLGPGGGIITPDTGFPQAGTLFVGVQLASYDTGLTISAAQTGATENPSAEFRFRGSASPVTTPSPQPPYHFNMGTGSGLGVGAWGVWSGYPVGGWSTTDFGGLQFAAGVLVGGSFRVTAGTSAVASAAANAVLFNSAGVIGSGTSLGGRSLA